MKITHKFLFIFITTLQIVSICAQKKPDATNECSKENGLSVKETRLDGAIDKVHWINDESNGVVFATTFGLKHTLMRSMDDGVTWEDLGNSLKNSKGNSIQSKLILHFNPSARFDHLSNEVIYVREEKTKDLWVSEDKGKSFSYRKLPSELASIYNFQMDRSNPKLALVVSPSSNCDPTFEPCNFELWLTQNSGRDWKKIRDNCFSEFSIGVNSNLFVRERKWGSESPLGRIIKSKDRGNSWEGAVDDTIGFAERDGTYFAVKNNEVGVGYRLFLAGEYGEHEWVQAQFPMTLSERGYTILFASSVKVMIHVNHGGDSYGNLYISNSPSHPQFTLSLSHHRRNYKGYGEILQVPQIPAVVIANIASSNPFDPSNSILTRISFNNGGDWSPIDAPIEDSKGNLVHCNERVTSPNSKCRLNLNGPYEEFYGKMVAPINAVGLVMATGTVGTDGQSATGDGRVNTYLSRDAGVSWKEVRQYSTLNAAANHGSLLLSMRDMIQSRNISYSWNFGTDWKECYLPSGFEVKKIHPGWNGTALHFLIEGEQVESGRSRGILTHLDFSGMHTRKCSDNDYEKWTPTNGKDSTHCLLGQSKTFKRRKIAEKCYSGVHIENFTEYSVCPCAVEDYECDFCHERIEGTSVCALVCDEELFKKEEKVCKGGKTHVSKGYRLIAGTMCDVKSGLDLNPEETECRGGGIKTPLYVTVLLMTLCFVGTVIFFIAILIAFKRNERFQGFVSTFASKLPKKFVDPFRSVEFVRLNTEDEEEEIGYR